MSGISDKDLNKPIFLYDPITHKPVLAQAGTTATDGNIVYAPIATTAGGSGGSGSSDVAIHDATTASRHLVINSDGSINTTPVVPFVVKDPTTPANQLKINSDGSINTAATFSAASLAINDGTTATNKLKVNPDGSIIVTLSPTSIGTTINDAFTSTNKLHVNTDGSINVNASPVNTVVASSDGQSSTTFPEMQMGLYNSANGVDRWRSIAVGDGVNIGIAATATYLYNGSNHERWRSDPTGVGRVSLYGKSTTAGDTPLKVGSDGSLSANISDPTTPTNKLKINADGSLNTTASFSATSLAINDGTTTSQKLAVDASGKIGVNNFPTTQAVSGAINIADPTTSTQKLAVNADGSINVKNVAVASSDGQASSTFPEIQMGLYNSSNAVDRWRSSAVGDGVNIGLGGIVRYLYNGTNHDRQQGKQGVADVSSGGRSTLAIAAGTSSSNTVVKASAGRLARVIVTAAGTASLLIYDNATTNSGTIIGALPATTTVGQVFDFLCPATAGITAAIANGTPAVTITYY
jgi:hypothetical protein